MRRDELQDIYHAGNFADVAKHVGLVYCLGALQRKDAPFFVLDSHAGRGYYDLQARRLIIGRAERGIQRLIQNSLGEKALPDYFADDPRAPRQAAGALSGVARIDRERLVCRTRAVHRADAGRSAGRRARGRVLGRTRTKSATAMPRSRLSAAGRAPRLGPDRSPTRAWTN